MLDPKGVSKLPANDVNNSETSTGSVIKNENSSQDHILKDVPSDMTDGEVVSFENNIVLSNSGLVLS